MRYYLISDSNDTILGMRLAGIEGTLVHNRDEVAEAIELAASDPSVGILLISEKCAAMCPDHVSEIKNTLKSPLLVEIPDRHGTGRAADSITRFIRESIGIKI